MKQNPNMEKNLFNRSFSIKALLIITLWATPPLVSKYFISTEKLFPAFYFGFLRYFTGFTTLAIIIIMGRNLRQINEIIKKYPLQIFICSLWLVLMVFGQNFSVYFILGSSSSVLLNYNPTIIYIISPLLFIDEKYSRKKTIGFILSTIGISIIFIASFKDSTIGNPDSILIGNLLGLLSGIAWAGYSLSLRKFFRDRDSLVITAMNLLISSLVLLLISLFIEKPVPLENFTVEAIIGIIIIGSGAAALAFTLYLQLVQDYGTIIASNIQFLIPIVSLILAWFFLGEFSLSILVGGLISATGVALITVEGKKR